MDMFDNPYGQNKVLMENQRYTLRIAIGNLDTSFTFYSPFKPLYCSAREVKTVIGDMFDTNESKEGNIPILAAIHQASLELEDLASANDLKIETPLSFTMRQWVKYKAALIVANRVLLTLAGKIGAEEVSLDKFRIVRQINIPSVNNLISTLQQQLVRYENALLSSTGSRVRSVVKAGSSSQFNLTRVF